MISSELFYLLEDYQKSQSEASSNQLKEKLKAQGIAESLIEKQLDELKASSGKAPLNETALKSEILQWQAGADVKKCNLAVYRAIAPFAELMYALEQNGSAIEHAFKLAMLFDDEKKALAYLSGFIKANPKAPQPLHDACLFALPTGNYDVKTWRKLCEKHMKEAPFRKLILPNASALESYIRQKSKKQPKEKGKLIKELAAKTKALNDLNVEFKKLKRKRAHLSELEKQRYDQLVIDLSDARKQLTEIGTPFNEQLTLTALIAYKKTRDKELSKELQYFQENGLTDNDFAKFLALLPKRQDDERLIPDITIDGERLGYPGVYLKKLDVMDDKQAARAACLGKQSKCCQSLSSEAGESCVVHGLTSPYGGFYIVCKGDVNNPQVSDPLLGQCWAWRSESGAIVFDSIEAPGIVKTDDELKKCVVTLYKTLALKLVEDEHTHKVSCGEKSGISSEVGIKSIFNAKEHFVEYQGYCDSTTQRAIADIDRPYYHYGVDPESTRRTDELINSFVQSNTINRQYFEMLRWAVEYQNTTMIDKVKNQLTQVEQYDKLNLLKKMESYLSQQWSEKRISALLQDSQHKALLLSCRDAKSQTPLEYAVKNNLVAQVSALTEAGADVNVYDSSSMTPLLCCINSKHCQRDF